MAKGLQPRAATTPRRLPPRRHHQKSPSSAIPAQIDFPWVRVHFSSKSWTPIIYRTQADDARDILLFHPPPAIVDSEQNSPWRCLSTTALPKLTSPLASSCPTEVSEPGRPFLPPPERRRQQEPPPPALLHRGELTSGHLPTSRAHPEVALEPLLRFPCGAPAAGEGARRKSTRPSLPCSEIRPGTSS